MVKVVPSEKFEVTNTRSAITNTSWFDSMVTAELVPSVLVCFWGLAGVEGLGGLEITIGFTLVGSGVLKDLLTVWLT